MQLVEGRFVFSATDLNNYLECRRLPELGWLVALGKLARPDVEDEQAELIREKGAQHEARYLEQLRVDHGADQVVEIARPEHGFDAYRAAEAETIAAMRNGAHVIYQATFFDGEFLGHADFLLRVNRPSNLGDYSYEAADTKLALSTKPYFIIQLCNYSEHLARVQGVMPEYGRIVFGDGKQEAYKLNNYLAYYRHVKARFLASIDEATAANEEAPKTYPLACEHCIVCPWNEACEQQRRDDDHLSLVAWMRRDQTTKLEANGITTVRALSLASDADRPPSMSPEAFVKLRKQAQLQITSRDSNEPIVELLPHDPRAGFGLLPEPNAGDVYFDMEGDPMYEPGRGLEYLFGMWLRDRTFKSFWGRTRAEEKRAFEQFIDFIVNRRKQFPALHVYHYANYEKAALQRLSQQHSTRGEELDDLLRCEVFVDLYAVVRQSMMVGEEHYSIKNLERFYGMQRDTGVKKGDQSIVMFERWRVTQDQSILDDIEAYNKDDCESTQLLHDWLLQARTAWIERYGDLPFRAQKTPDQFCHDEPFEGCPKCRNRVKAEREEQQRTDLERELLRGVIEPETDDEYYNMGEPMRTRYLLGHALSYHRREEKPVWWEFFKRCENVDELLDRDREALAGLELVDDVAPYRLGERDRNFVYTYRFPEQRHKMDVGDAYDPLTGKSAGTIVELDDDTRIVRVKRPGTIDDARRLTALVPGKPIGTKAQRAALVRIAQAYLSGSLQREFPATLDLLSARNPRVTLPTSVLQPENVCAHTVSEVVRSLNYSYLFIQGPPGTGKSTIGSEVICDLIKAGKRVGIMSNSHKAIHNLLHKVEYCMAKHGDRFHGLYKHSNGNGGSAYVSQLAQPFIESVAENAAFDGDGYNLAGGTAWLFSRPELAGKFDYLFIDEAGQVSLADALAVSLCASNIVLLGDPSQLAQVNQGCHAPHCDDSILQHLLGKHSTVQPKRGIFLDRSFRMHPKICSFISDSMYDGRLKAGDKTHLHRVTSPGLSGSGLRYIPMDHSGNAADSPEEAERIVAEISFLLHGTVADDDGMLRRLTERDIIVVTPYNAHRRLIQNRLKAAAVNISVGTVDKFQGQQAAIVFYSMASSSVDDVPRNLGFLLEANRFNVAVSRARAMTVLVCNPRLLDAQCSDENEMELTNLLCTYLERCDCAGPTMRSA